MAVFAVSEILVNNLFFFSSKNRVNSFSAHEVLFRKFPPLFSPRQGVILVYDITNRWSFDGIDRWIKEIDEVSDQSLCQCL